MTPTPAPATAPSPRVTYDSPIDAALNTLDRIEAEAIATLRLIRSQARSRAQVRTHLEEFIMAADNLGQALDREEADVSAAESVGALTHSHIQELRQQLTDAQTAQQNAAAALQAAADAQQAAADRINALDARIEQLTTQAQTDTTA